MNYELIHDGELKTWVAILSSGDEVKQSLMQIARGEGLHGAHFTAIGALERCVLGYFDWSKKKYRKNAIDEQVEVASLIGDITLKDKDGEPKIHMHAVLGKADASACAGHLMEGHVRPTLEVIITEAPAHLRRRHDPQSGLALIHLDKELP